MQRVLITTMLGLTLLPSPIIQIKQAVGQSLPNQRTDSSATRANESAQVDALMAPWSTGGTPGAALLVIQNDRILHAKGYGMADLKTKAPIGSDTVFDLASVSKQFTAMAVMILAERGRLSYDDPLSKFLPEFPTYAQKITIRHLLQHTSGLRDYEKILYDSRRVKMEPGGFEPRLKDIVKLLAEQNELRFEPGTKWEYSNSGYELLARIIEKVSGKTYPQFAKENIFRPLGMKHTVVYDETKPKIKGRALSYNGNTKGFTNVDYHPLNLVYGSGGINSTIMDMYRWDQALYTEKLVKAPSLKQAFTPGKLNDGTSTGYGFGWFVGENFGLGFVSHGGGWVGFRTYIIRYPVQHFTIVVLSNLAQFDPNGLAAKVSRIYLADKMILPVQIKVASEILQRYVGRYELPPNIILEVILENGTLFVKDPGPMRLKLVPKSEVKFFVEGRENIIITFNKDETGNIVSLTLNESAIARKLR